MVSKGIARILRQIRPWLEPGATAATLVAALFAALAAGYAASSANSAELQTTSLIGTSRPYLVVEAATIHIHDNNPNNFAGITLTVGNAGKHPAHHPTIEFAVVDAKFQLVEQPAVQSPAIDILGGRTAKATYGPSPDVALGSTYFVVRLSYADPILDGRLHVNDECFAYESLAEDPALATTAACTHDEFERATSAVYGTGG